MPSCPAPTSGKTRILAYGPAAIAEGAAVIRTGGVVAIPTETVYGLAADATQAQAVSCVYAAKGRPAFNPLIVHVADVASAEALAHFSPAARALADRFWPGPLTLILPIRAPSPITDAVSAGLPTLALRVPNHPAMQALLLAADRPLAAPSANASGCLSPTEAKHVVLSLDGRIPLVIDGGATSLGVESTIVKIIGDEACVLRPGPITPEALAPYVRLNPAARFPSAQGAVEGVVEAPGQTLVHYAPNKPLRLEAAAGNDDEWFIGFGPLNGHDNLSPAGDLSEAASRLFAALHKADEAPYPRIAIAHIPGEGVGCALNDRLRRAAMGKDKRPHLLA